MRLLEGAGTARATATGMAAVSASLLSQLNSGDHVVAARALFGSCRYVTDVLLPRFGIATTLVDGTDMDAWRKAVKKNTKAFFLETPSNPNLEIIDLMVVSEIAHDAGARVVVDNVFATPILQQPMKFGCDIVVYSATKHIDGQGRCMGGVVLCNEAFLKDHLEMFLRHTGPALSPFNAWVLLKSLDTLDIRVRESCRTAALLANHLAVKSQIDHVLYPARNDHKQHKLAMSQMEMGGSLVSFFLKGGKEIAFRFANALKLIRISNNLGDAKSLITHPATTTHQRLTPEARAELGITDTMLRISVGLEDVEDLREDIDQALATL
jgi:O-succinylhomoserine sulfhydrylase